MESILFINENIGFAVGNPNIILKTEDGGTNWIKQSITAEDHQLTSVFFTDEEHGFIAGVENIFLTTTNGGQNWVIHKNINYTPLSVFFINSNIGWRVGSEGTIEKTVDNGETWIMQSKRFTWDSFQKVDFIDDRNGWIVSNESIYRTFDGGDSWSLQKSILAQGIDNLFAVDNLHCWVVGSNWESDAFILNTTDGGNNWNNQPIQFKGDLLDLYFFDQNIGWIVGDSGAVFSTQNGGQNWIRQETGTSERLISTDFINKDQGWVASSEGKIFYTLSGGKEWQVFTQKDIPSFQAIEFIDSQNGWGVGGVLVLINFGVIIRGYIYNTADGGATWQLQLEDSVDAYSSIKFIDKNTCWVAGNGSVLFTIDGGANWQRQLLIGGLSSLDFVDTNNGWLVGDYGVIIHTKSGGATFIEDPEKLKTSILSNFSLSQNYPNPFNPITNIEYRLANTDFVNLSIYNILGQKVITLVNKKQPAGSYQMQWDATGFASGIYYYKLSAGDFKQVKKMILMK